MTVASPPSSIPRKTLAAPCETGFVGQALKASAALRPPLSVLRSPIGGARRDRTDDLMLAKHALSQLSYGPLSSAEAKGHGKKPAASPWRGMVGLGRLELPTSRLSSARSNQLSYKPKLLAQWGALLRSR